MRKVLIFCVALLCTPVMWGQFVEDFDASTSLPAGWSVINQGSTPGWVVDDAPDGGARSGTNVMGIEFGSVAHDDYLIAPAINVVSGSTNRVEFFIRSRSSFFAETYEVLLSTTGSASADFNVILQEESTAPATWTPVSISLEDYAGQTVYVAIRATGTDEFELYVDDFELNGFTPLANDDCEGAVELTCGNALTNQTTIGAFGGSSSSCIGTIGDDVWYSFVATTESSRIIVNSNTAGEFVQVEVYESSDGSCSGFTLNSCSFTEGIGQNPVPVAFLTNIGSTYYVRVGNYINGNPGVDFDIELECITCSAPADLASGTIDIDEIELTWTAPASNDNWNIEYGLSGFTQGSGIVVNVTTNPATITGLTSATEYDFYIRAACGTDQSEWVGPLTESTGCGSVMSSEEVDMDISPPNSCWSEAASGAIADGPSGFGSGSWDGNGGYINGNGDVVNSNSINLFTTTTNDWLITPLIDASLATTADDQIVVEVAVTDFLTSGIGDTPLAMGSDDVVTLLISRDGGAWEELTNWTEANNPGATGTQFIVPLAAETGTVQLAFHGSDGPVDDAEDYDFHVGVFNFEFASLGTVDLTVQPDVAIYPNPATNELTIDAKAGVRTVRVYNMAGKLVLTGMGKNKLNVAGLASGSYVVQIGMENGLITSQRFIKK